MDNLIILAFVVATCDHALSFCVKSKLPLEMGKWKHDLVHLHSAVVENTPVSMLEGQMYVYENDFPGYTIKYIHVDNVAVRTCGASATLKNGGIGTSTVMLILHADTNQEIRSVIDIWGVKSPKQEEKRETTRRTTTRHFDMNLKSRYISKHIPLFNNFNR